MPKTFLDRLCDSVLNPDILSKDENRDLIIRAIADTLAVAAAGFPEPVTRNVLKAYGGNGPVAWSGEPCESEEAAILVNGAAAHALDFDDVYLESMAHISTVLVPAVLRPSVNDPEAILEAFAAGLIAAKAVARRVGAGHYHKGFHGTATIGTFAAAAACGRLAGLTADEMANAFALAASMSAGLQVNFSTQTKPVHAGLAASAGYRAARLAKAGVTGSRDIFRERGYAALYGAGDGDDNPTDSAFELRPDMISVKLYPCCYASHRLVAIALDARSKIGASISDADTRYVMSVPASSISLLKHHRPQDSMQAKFSPTYPVAVALLRGTPTLADFADAAIADAQVASIIDRIEILEDDTQPSAGDIEFGTVTFTVMKEGHAPCVFTRSALPGSPLDPPAFAALREKFAGCLRIYNDTNRSSFPILERAGDLSLNRWLSN
ncbi:hypothetical protein CYG48_18940 (plasmid) [Neorhizobium sp. SOG26]|uniref:MmgE/PrpD family protein n=1 Tax=Neorhizobium sp. SOG26 TaxID=2060726 RepID=UPI000E57727C|nr:MmgE/PrpD family protein [Neorhizobium sp. SOG26]AXV17868.1 hypothetical protein CYG48_18940 [Neorhizobium sp. SOG26]